MLDLSAKNWANQCNEKFKEKGLSVQVDAYFVQRTGIDRIPMIHEDRMYAQWKAKESGLH